MSNNKTSVIISEDVHEACNDRLNRVEQLSINRQMPTNTERSLRHTVSEFSAIAHDSGAFINGDLIDLCGGDLECGGGGGARRDLVEAINSQLLADINGKSQTTRDCYVLYPTKVLFDNNNKKIAGNHMKHLNNCVDLSNSTVATAATRSSEAIGRCSESATNDQHQTVIREFKRLGTYCTLRPEQRRKHLLKVLPTLRNSMLLQTLLGSNVNVTKNIAKIDNNNSGNDVGISNIDTTDDQLLATNKDIDSLLIDLDGFIIDGNTALMQRQNNEKFTSTESFASNCDTHSQRSLKNDINTSITSTCYAANNTDELNASCIKIDPDKVEDCLLELDAYLEEIDRDYVLACAANVPSTSSLPLHSANHIKTTTKISANLTSDYSEKTSKNHIDSLFNMDNLLINCNGGSTSSTQANQLIDSCCHDSVFSASNLRKQISNSDIQMNQCGKLDDANKINGSRNIDNKRKSTEFANDQPLKRGHKLRNTVAVSGQNNRIHQSNATTSHSGKF